MRVLGHLLFLVVVIALGVVSYEYFLHWDVGYHSDTAVIGLMAKHIAEFGERPIYVWSVGYQGIFLEAYLTALLFKLFGVSPAILTLAPTITFWFALGVWTWIIARNFSIEIALLAALLTIISTPIFYYWMFRTSPNFPEALLIGSLFWMFFEYRTLGNWTYAAMGFCAGFGAYTFLLADYFVIAVAASLILPKGFHKNWIAPFRYVSSKPLRILTLIPVAICYLWFLFGFLALILGFREVSPFGIKIGADPLWTMTRPVLIILSLSALFQGIPLILQNKVFHKRAHRFAGGLLVGYSPALYYTFVLHGQTTKHVNFYGDWPMIWERIKLFFEFHAILFNVSTSPLGPIAALATVAGILIAMFHWGKRRSPLFFLPIVMWLIFPLAGMVVDIKSGRYLVFLVLVYSVTTVWSLGWAYKKWKRPVVGIVGAAIYFVILINNTISVRRDLNESGDRAHFEAIVHALDEHHITRGYGDYWVAYAVDFLTNERIILEPTMANYCPHYGPLVKKESSLGFVSENPALRNASQIELYGTKYRILKRYPADPRTDLYLLEKM